MKRATSIYALIGPGLLSDNDMELEQLLGVECKFSFFNAGTDSEVQSLENVKALLKDITMTIGYYDDVEGIVKYEFSKPIPLWILDIIIDEYLPVTVIYN